MLLFYIRRLSKWSNLSNTITFLTSVDSLSLGDALRDLDAKDILRKDFILLQAGVVTNLELRPLLDKHREIVKVDKGAVMSLVHRKMLPGHRSRSKNPYQNPVVVVDSKTNRIVSYNIKVPTKKLTIPLVSYLYFAELRNQKLNIIKSDKIVNNF